MTNQLQGSSKSPRAVLIAAAFAAALVAGAAMAGWLNHGTEIFLSMAADAWAYCF